MSTLTIASAPYPRAHVVDVALRDGSTLHVRPVATADALAIKAFLEGLSAESIGFRFFGSPSLDWATGWSVDVDYANRYALVATAGAKQEIVAHGAYVRLDEYRAEVAFMVADAWQGKGIATIMLAHLAAAAEEHGISTLLAEVLPHNHRMIDVFVESGFPVARRRRQDAVEVEMPSSISERTREHFEQRDRTAAVAALRSFLEPRSVALIGPPGVGGRSAGNCSTTSSSGASPVGCTSSTTRPRPSRATRPTPRSARCRASSSSP